MTSMNMPEAEVNIDPSLVRELLQEQRPDLADLPLMSWPTVGTTSCTDLERISLFAFPDALRPSN